jgi:hypothetical protein
MKHAYQAGREKLELIQADTASGYRMYLPDTEGLVLLAYLSKIGSFAMFKHISERDIP